MKKKKQILRIRPFNMANFSGAGGYIPIFAIFGALLSFPATLLIWIGLALSVENEDGEVNEAIIKRRLLRILPPIYLVALVIWYFIASDQISIYGGSLFVAMIALVIVVGINFVGIYASIYFSAKLLNRNTRRRFKKARWFFQTMVFAAVMVFVCIFLSFMLLVVAFSI